MKAVLRGFVRWGGWVLGATGLSVGCGGGSNDAQPTAEAPAPTTVMVPNGAVDETPLIVDAPPPAPTAPDAEADPPIQAISMGNEPEPIAPPQPTGPEPTCFGGLTQLTGTLDGSAVDVKWSASPAQIRASSRGWELTLSDSSARGMLYLNTDGDFDTAVRPKDAIDEGTTVNLLGGMLLRPDAEVRSPYCIGSGSSLERRGDEVVVDLKGMNLLGQCPGEPVEGELMVCAGDAEECADGQAMGIVDGYDYGAVEWLGGSFGSGEAWSLRLPNGMAHWTEASDGPDEAMGIIDQGAMNNGVIINSDGTVYCFSSDSRYVEYDNNRVRGHYVLTMRDFSTLGDCSSVTDGDGTLTGCLR